MPFARKPEKPEPEELPVARINYSREQLRILDWRVDCLTEAGCQLQWAQWLAKLPDLDLHVACALFRACEHDLALKILV